MRKLFTVLIFSFIINISFGQTTISEQILFDFNQSKIGNAELSKLDNFILSAVNKSEKIIQIIIDGHTDNIGSDRYNKSLSDKRAKAVYDRMIELGITPKVVSYQGFGEQELLIAQGDKNTQKENRRVTIRITHVLKQPKKPVVEAVKFTLSDLYQNAKIPYDIYNIQAGEETFIDGKQGTRLQFTTNAFNHLKKGTPIEIRMTEYYKYSDMILANLTTELNGNMLSTGGMIYAEAFVNGQPTNMTGQAYVWFPNKDRDMTGMQPYIGEDGEQGVTWARYAGMENVSNNLRKNYSYLRGEGFSCGNDAANSRKTMSRWKAFWYKFLYGKEQLAAYYLPRGKEALRVEYGLNVDTMSSYKAFENFSENNAISQNEMQAILAYEILSINQLGWINCDRFNNVLPEDKRTLTINTKMEKNLSIKVICNKQNGMMAAYPNGKNYAVAGLPKNLNVTVVAIRTSNDKPELAIKKLSKIKDLTEADLVFTAYDDLTELRKVLKTID